MMEVTKARRGWAIFALAIGLQASAMVLMELRGRSSVTNSEAIAGFAFLSFGLVAALILARYPKHRLGYVFAATALITALASATDEYAKLAASRGEDLPGWIAAAWIQNWIWFAPVALVFTFGMLLFPDGHLPSGRWKPVAWAAVIGFGGFSVVMALTEGPLDGFPGVPNPTGVLPDDGLSLAFFLVGVAAAIGCVISLVFRYRSADTTLRLQLKYVMFGAVLALILVLGMPYLPLKVSQVFEDVLFGIVMCIFPVACGIAILRYRLYDIDVIINRALVYGALTAILAGAYLGIVFALQQILPLGDRSDVAVAASTLAVAALFRPARARVQAFIDRRFFRRRYDAAATLETFAARLRSEVALEEVERDVLETLRATLAPAHASLWMRDAV